MTRYAHLTGRGHRAALVSHRPSHAILVSLLLLGACVAPVWAQTGQVMPPPKFVEYDNNGDPCAGCKLFSYVAGTTTKQNTYTSSTLGTPNANPVILDSAGRATVFLNPTFVHKFVLAPASDTDPPANPIYTVDNVVGGLSGVVNVTVASTRGLTISRAGAASGLSIASTGGSGKTWGFESTTSGELKIQDDADGSPRVELGSGEAIDLVTTGTVSVTSTASAALDVGGGIQAGSGNVGIVDSSGKIPAISSTYFASVSGANLTGIPVSTGLSGAWSSVAFSAGDYTANGAMTWTVDALDVGGSAYITIGKTLIWSLYLYTTTIGGTANTDLRVAIPGGLTIAGVCAGPMNYTDGTNTAAGHWTMLPAQAYVTLQRWPSTNFAATGTNNTGVWATMICAIS